VEAAWDAFVLMASWFKAASARTAMSVCLCSLSLSISTSKARLPVIESVVNLSLGAQRE